VPTVNRFFNNTGGGNVRIYLLFFGSTSYLTQPHSDPLTLFKAVMKYRSKFGGLVLENVQIGHDPEQNGLDFFIVSLDGAFHQSRHVNERIPLPEKDTPKISFGPPSDDLAQDLAQLWSKPIQYIFLNWRTKFGPSGQDIILIKTLL
jgi:hypothetical protein